MIREGYIGVSILLIMFYFVNEVVGTPGCFLS